MNPVLVALACAFCLGLAVAGIATQAMHAPLPRLTIILSLAAVMVGTLSLWQGARR